MKWVPLDPVVVNVRQIALASKSLHPNAALLFLDFLLGAEGQKLLADSGFTGAGDKIPFPVWIPEGGRTADQIDKDFQRWNQLFTTTFRR